MKTPLSLLPDASTLTARLTASLASGGTAPPLAILERKLPFMMSTFPNEVVTCQWPDGRKQQVFIKYEGRHTHNAFGHRGGIAYEAEIYRKLLQSWPDFHPRFYGSHTDPDTGETWLLLEYVDQAARVSDMSLKRQTGPTPPLVQVGRWIGEFHAAHEARAAKGDFPFMHRYDAAYYRGWARRTFQFARPLRRRFAWLTELRRCGDAWFAPLCSGSPTVIHGEFYPKTVLWCPGRLCPVDWESAAIGPGEIDLAALTEGRGWPRSLVRKCEAAYRRARWPDGVPAGFQPTLDAARIYLQFRWLGERPDWTTQEGNLWRYEELHLAAKRLTLI